MKQEDKELLLKDICARLPYGVRAKFRNYVDIYSIKSIDASNTDYYPITLDNSFEQGANIDEVKPYLRPMSSMTDEEKFSYHKTQWEYQADYCAPEYFDGLESYDWLNAHHFDFRNLIERGLALEAPNGMYD